MKKSLDFHHILEKSKSTVEVKQDKILGEERFLFLLFHLNKSLTSTAVLILCTSNRVQRKEREPQSSNTRKN